MKKSKDGGLNVFKPQAARCLLQRKMAKDSMLI